MCHILNDSWLRGFGLKETKSTSPMWFFIIMSGKREEERACTIHQRHSDKAYLTTKRGERSKANRDRVKISPALTDLSSLLHDGEAFIYYFKEVEKIITTVIPHLMCPKPPITPWPAALCWIYIERAHPCSKTDGHESFLLCKISS